MARIRSVKPEFWTSEQVMNMSRDARLLFIGLWNFSDDNGVHPASAISLKAEALPGDEITADQVMSFVDEMIEQELLEEYEVDGRTFWRVTGWRRHQRIDHPTYRHPTGDTGDARGDTGDAKSDASPRVTSQNYKRLGGKQRQIVLKKLRHRDGDACSLCGDSSNLSILSLAPNGEENSNEISQLRLICSACKRKSKTGDAKKSQGDAGDTQGDAKVLGGDSPRERSGEEWRVRFTEGSGNSKPLLDDSTTTSPGDAPDHDHPSETIPTARNVQIALLLRAQGVQATAQNPIVCVIWAQDPRVTDDVLNVAIAKARAAKPAPEQIPVKYLARIVEQELTEQAAPPPAARPKNDDWEWKRSKEGIERKGRELGLFARGGESHDSFRDRIQAAIDKRKGQP